jgi:hypothetical protein
MIPEVKTCCIPYTVCKMIKEDRCQVIKCQRCRMVPEVKTCMVPYVTCRKVPVECVKMVPVTTCHMEPYIVMQKICRRIPMCVPVPACPPPCPAPVPGCAANKMGNTEWYARMADRARNGIVPVAASDR